MGATRLDRGRHLRRCIQRKTQSYRYISTFLFAYCGVQHIMVFFVLFVFALCFAYPMSVFALNFFHLLARKTNLEKLSIYSNKFFHILHFLWIQLWLFRASGKWVSAKTAIVVSNTYCVVFFVCLSSSCVLCCQFLWNIHSWLPLGFSLTFIFVLCLVYPMLPVSLEYPFLIVPYVFS